ncbi:myb/SANT-like DNA-binding domain-containing protein 4 [Argopecten irradians]|uniref:myb/SANT-like DNA-binding domain-containing protein 4 n=1 Tax=Argopecten irradians TaxID=31199 RepID=UPI003719ECC0
MANIKRQRGKNFDAEETILLTELVEKNIGLLNSKLTNTITNQRKQTVWVSIAAQVSSLGKSVRTVKDVKTKWSNITTSAKKEFSAHKIYSKGTGGGPAPKPMDATTERVVELFKDSPNFIGLGGMESSMPTPAQEDLCQERLIFV